MTLEEKQIIAQAAYERYCGLHPAELVGWADYRGKDQWVAHVERLMREPSAKTMNSIEQCVVDAIKEKRQAMAA